jgi:hypothetical protein
MGSLRNAACGRSRRQAVADGGTVAHGALVGRPSKSSQQCRS